MSTNGTQISPRAQIDAGVYIGHNVTIYGYVSIKKGTIIEDNCIIGKPSRKQLSAFREQLRTTLKETGKTLPPEDYDQAVVTPTLIGEDVTIQGNSVIFSGVTLAAGVLCEDFTTIRWDTQVGVNTAIRLNALVGSYITIGDHSRISGLLGNSSKIGRYVTTGGVLIHAYRSYGGNRLDPAPTIEDYASIGRNAIIVGGITLGQYAYVAAGAIVTKDVPPQTLVTGVNQFRPFEEWEGAQGYVTSFPPASPS